MHSTIFCLTGSDIDDSFFWFVMYFCHGKQLCLAVSLISTAANSAWNGELGDKCRQGCAETVVGWQEGTNGTGKGCRVYTGDARLVSHDCIFFSGWFIKAQHVWCPRNQVSGLRCFFYYSSKSNAIRVLCMKQYVDISCLPYWTRYSLVAREKCAFLNWLAVVPGSCWLSLGERVANNAVLLVISLEFEFPWPKNWQENFGTMQ